MLRAGAFRPSELTAQRPTGRSTPSVIHRQGISHCHVSDSDRIVSVLSIDAERETAEVALYYCVLTTTQQKGCRASRPLSAFPFTPFCQTAVHSRIGVGLPARRPPPPLTSTRDVLMICDSPPHRAQEHVTALPASSATLSCRATPLTAAPFHLPPRRVRSNDRSRRRAVRAVFPRIVFFANEAFGE